MFLVGGVIQHGEKILDIVPTGDGLVVEVQIAVEDISEVHPGMPAELQLTAYKQHVVPTLPGRIAQVSADRLTDPRSNGSFFVVSIRPDPAALASLTNVHLYPGMPVGAMIPTESRTALDHALGPLLSSFRYAFRQK